MSPFFILLTCNAAAAAAAALWRYVLGSLALIVVYEFFQREEEIAPRKRCSGPHIARGLNALTSDDEHRRTSKNADTRVAVMSLLRRLSIRKSDPAIVYSHDSKIES